MTFKTFLPVIGLLTGCTFFGVDGQHNAWKEFYNRCVAQIAINQPVKVDDLEQRSVQNIEQRLRASQDPSDTYWGPKNFLWVLQVNTEQNSCKMYAKGRGIGVYSRGSNWLEDAFDRGEFNPNHHSNDEGILRYSDGRSAYIYVAQEDHNEFMKDAFLAIAER